MKHFRVSIGLGYVGSQKLAPEKFYTDYYYNYSCKLYKSKQQGINTSQFEIQAVDFFDHKYYNFYLDDTIRNSPILVVLPLVSPSLSLFLFLDKFFYPISLLPFFGSPSFCLPPLFYSFGPCSYHHSYLAAS